MQGLKGMTEAIGEIVTKKDGVFAEQDEEFYAYLAGLIDGEGWVGITRRFDPRYRRGYWEMPIIDVANTNKEVLEIVKERIGFGRIYSQARGTSKPVHHLKFYPTNLRKLLPHIAPYLVIKRDQAEKLARVLELTRTESE